MPTAVRSVPRAEWEALVREALGTDLRAHYVSDTGDSVLYEDDDRLRDVSWAPDHIDLSGPIALSDEFALVMALTRDYGAQDYRMEKAGERLVVTDQTPQPLRYVGAISVRMLEVLPDDVVEPVEHDERSVYRTRG